MESKRKDLTLPDTLAIIHNSSRNPQCSAFAPAK